MSALKAVSREFREVVADWLMAGGAIVLFASLFFTWSHQYSASFAAAFAGTDALTGIPRDPNAWQVYSIVDVLLAVLAVAVLALSLFGPRRPRIVALCVCVMALAFVVHALDAAPTSGVNAVTPPSQATTGLTPALPANDPTAGAGETLALIALLGCCAGLGLSLTAD